MPAILGLFWTGAKALFGGLVTWLIVNGGSIVASILISLGLYFVVAQPVSAVIGNQIQAHFNALHAGVIETAYYLNLDDYITMILSAYAVRAARNAGKVSLAKKTAPTVSA